MTDQQYDALSQAIADGKPLQDPVFQEIPALALDPQQDAELIQAIESKGEDGPHFIDGLIDYACLLYTSPSPRDRQKSRMPSSA